ncbi:ABC-three component system middle component 2 [Tenacibaculum agarivorans]|uniref:ABC-three component system middle component 2 n=1 Tax=Tenacibaculum agarivorans TaxID=1908389 RepID=UPI00094B8252|nr:ABC-three component system middle component 2 [Tenacibaculum agarivorans]
MKNKTSPFNNEIESGLRVLFLLNEIFPEPLSIEKIIYLDYFTIHSADVDETQKSIHPPVPYRFGEFYVRRNITQNGINLFLSKNLIDTFYSRDGIQYKASENSTPFLDNLSESYSLQIKNKVTWVVNTFSKYNLEELKTIAKEKLEFINNEYNLEILN